MRAAPHKQIAEIPLVAHLMIVGRIVLPEKPQCLPKRQIKVLVHQLAVICLHNVVVAAPLMHAETERAVPIGISERILHFHAVALRERARRESLPEKILPHCLPEKAL